jgi:predicted transcriptional regulator
MKLSDAEIKVLDILWEKGDTTAKKIAETLKEKMGWSKTTTYTLITRCMEKGAVGREDPDFLCHALVTKQKTQETETGILVNKLFDGAPYQLIASILGRKNLSPEKIEKLKKFVKTLE